MLNAPKETQLGHNWARMSDVLTERSLYSHYLPSFCPTDPHLASPYRWIDQAEFDLAWY